MPIMATPALARLEDPDSPWSAQLCRQPSPPARAEAHSAEGRPTRMVPAPAAAAQGKLDAAQLAGASVEQPQQHAPTHAPSVGHTDTAAAEACAAHIGSTQPAHALTYPPPAAAAEQSCGMHDAAQTAEPCSPQPDVPGASEVAGTPGTQGIPAAVPRTSNSVAPLFFGAGVDVGSNPMQLGESPVGGDDELFSAWHAGG